MTLRLHTYFRSSTSYRVRIALNLKELPYESVSVNLKTGEHRDAPFAHLSPYQTLPVLEVAEKAATGTEPTPVSTYFQSLAILSWLEERYPSPALLPAANGPAAGAGARDVCRELTFAIASEVHAPNNVSVLGYLKKNFNADAAALEAWNQHWMSRTFAAVEKRLEAWNWQNDALPFGAPTWLEVVLVPQVYNARRWNLDMARFPRLERVDAHCRGLPAFAQAHPHAQPDCPPELREEA